MIDSVDRDPVERIRDGPPWSLIGTGVVTLKALLVAELRFGDRAVSV